MFTVLALTCPRHGSFRCAVEWPAAQRMLMRGAKCPRCEEHRPVRLDGRSATAHDWIADAPPPPPPRPAPVATKKKPGPKRNAAKTCTVEGCGRPHDARGLCTMHVQRLRNHGSTDKPQRRPRAVCACGRLAHAHGKCNACLTREARKGQPKAQRMAPVCTWRSEPCSEPTWCRGLCSRHYWHARNHNLFDQYPAVRPRRKSA